MELILIKYCLKTLELFLSILLVVYFIGLGFLVFCDMQDQLMAADFDHDNESLFLFKFDFVHDSPMRAMIKINYWAFTTMTTVGFGDLHPRSDAERILVTLLFLLGIGVFSYIMGSFIEILNMTQ